MDIQQLLWTEQHGWRPVEAGEPADMVETPIDAELVIYFGNAIVFDQISIYEELRKHYPYAHIVGSSVAREICGKQTLEGTVTSVAIRFRDTSVRIAHADIKRPEQSYSAGVQLGEALADPNLKAVLLLADGTIADTGVIAAALGAKIKKDTPISGLVSSTGLSNVHTFTGADASPQAGKLVAVGLYGTSVSLSSGAFHGCVPLGAEHTITKAQGHIVYELDGIPALQVYRKYLKNDHVEGDQMRLLFPFLMHRENDTDHAVLRSVVFIDEDAEALILGGHAPEGRKLQIMMSRPDQMMLDKEADLLVKAKLVDRRAKGDVLVLVTSDVARAVAFGEPIKREPEYIHDLVGSQAIVVGGYGNGIFMTMGKGAGSRLHNYTTNVAVLQEI